MHRTKGAALGAVALGALAPATLAQRGQAYFEFSNGPSPASRRRRSRPHPHRWGGSGACRP